MSRCGECPSWVKEKCDENLAYDECIDMLQDVLHELPSRPSAVYAYLKNKIGDIVDSETEFDAWFKRMVWHVKECDRLAREPKQGEWIPCSEGLPDEEFGTYLICTEGGYMCSCRWTNDMYGLGETEWSKWGWHIMDKPQFSVVTAWMPLQPWDGADDESLL